MQRAVSQKIAHLSRTGIGITPLLAEWPSRNVLLVELIDELCFGFEVAYHRVTANTDNASHTLSASPQARAARVVMVNTSVTLDRKGFTAQST